MIGTPTHEHYASHIMVLERLAAVHDLKHVLELGAGDHSTPWFLGLPTLERLVSIETDESWAETTQFAYADPRLDLRLVANTADAIADIELTDFDLILIDNGDNVAERLEAINAVLARPHPLVVVHDAQVSEYAKAIAPFDPAVVGVPWTAVIR